MVICLEQGTNVLHMVQLMPLPPHHLLLQLNPEWFTFLVLTQVVLEKRPLNGCSSSLTLRLCSVGRAGDHRHEVGICVTTKDCLSGKMCSQDLIKLKISFPLQFLDVSL